MNTEKPTGAVCPETTKPAPKADMADVHTLIYDIRGSVQLALEFGAHNDFQSFCQPVISSLGAVARLLDIAIERHGFTCASHYGIPENMGLIPTKPKPDRETTTAYLCAEVLAMLRQARAIVDLLLFDGAGNDCFSSSHSTVLVSLGAVDDLLNLASDSHERIFMESI